MKAILTFSEKSAGKGSKAGLLLAVLVLTAVIYSYLPSCGFIFMDDDYYITNSSYIKDFTHTGIKKNVLSFFNEELPITLMSFALDYKLWGLNPGPYHAENVVFHLLNVLLVFFLIYLICQKYEVTLLTALFFGIHPYRVESVAWIVERKDMLYAFFYLLGLISYIFYIRKKFKIHFLILSLFFFLLSLMSKTAAIVFPFVLFLIDYWEDRKVSFQLFLEKAPFFFIVIISLWIHSLVSLVSTQTAYEDTGLSFASRIFMGFYAFSYYVLGFFAPYNFSFTHLYPNAKDMVGLPLVYYFSPIFVLLFLWGMDRMIKKLREERKEIIFGFLFFIFSIGLVLHLAPIGGAVVVAERYTYMAYLGLFFIVSSLFVKFMETPGEGTFKIKSLLCILLAAYILFFSLATERRCRIWKNSLPLLNEIIEKNPTWPNAYNLRAVEKGKNGDNQGAAEDFEKSIRLAPHRDDLYFDRGVFRKGLKDYHGAVSDLSRAIELHPPFFRAFAVRGTTYAELGNYTKAVADYSKAIALNPNHSEPYWGRGVAKFRLHDPDGAFLDYGMSIRLNPSFDLVYFDRGMLYLSQKRFDEALGDFSQALKIDPQMEGAYFNRAVCYFHKKGYTKAWKDIHKIQQMGGIVPEQFFKELDSKMQEPEKYPSRVKGLPVFFVFRQIAKPLNLPRGFSIKEGSRVLSMPDADALMDFVLKQEKTVQENGIWLAGEDSKFYCEEDKRMEARLKDLCLKNNIPLFIKKNKDFPEGWRRFS
ncbi:MAG: tetratricopeptide repeat protein [Candidatus Omnitrophota bacterium]|jgi:tetratricopeptide (TPR) repeat protein